MNQYWLIVGTHFDGIVRFKNSHSRKSTPVFKFHTYTSQILQVTKKIIDRNILKALNKTYDFSRFPPILESLLISQENMSCCNLRYFHNDWILNCEKQVDGSVVKVLTTFFKFIEKEIASFWWNFHQVPEVVEMITSGATSDGDFVTMATFPFQSWWNGCTENKLIIEIDIAN